MWKGAKVHGNFIGKSQAQGDEDEDWLAIDSKIKLWFYCTCDANILQITSNDNYTSKYLWDKLDEFFLNKKMSHKNLAEALANCDSLMKSSWWCKFYDNFLPSTTILWISSLVPNCFHCSLKPEISSWFMSLVKNQLTLLVIHVLLPQLLFIPPRIMENHEIN